jgi:hypothetical protein
VQFSGATFNFDNYAPTSSPTIPISGGTITGNVAISGNLTVTGSTNIGTVTNLSVAQGSNGADAISGKRITDTAPTGNFLHFRNAANTTDLWTVDVTGSLLTGIIPAGRVSGTLAASNLPNPTASTLGGIESLAAVSHTWINAISTAGVPSATQPAFTDVSGSLACSQHPALTGDVTTSAGSCATTLATVGATKGGTGQTTYSTGDTLYSSAANTLSKLTGNTTTTKNFLTQTGTGAASAAPAWGTIASGDLTSALASPPPVGGTTPAPGSFTTDTGKRFVTAGGTALTSAKFVLSAGWGSTATVGSILGTDGAFSFVVTSSGTGQAANPATTVTFADGAWTNSPICVVSGQQGNAAQPSFIIGSVSTTTVILNAAFTPAATGTYGASVICSGR